MLAQRTNTTFWVIFITITFTLGANAAVEVDLQQVTDGEVEAVFLQDLSLSGMVPSVVLFSASVRSDISIDEAYFVMSLWYENEEILSGQTNTFQLGPGIIHLTNLDLTDEGSPFQVENFVLQPGAEAVRQQLFSNGFLPAGTYILALEAYQSASEPVNFSRAELSVQLSNPSGVSLKSPGGSPDAPGRISELTPVFTWASPAKRFLLEIWEAETDKIEHKMCYRTPADAPLLDKSFLYPGSGVQVLEPNQTYHWQVAALIQTPKGEKSFYSSIGAFSIQDEPETEARRILASLKRLLERDYQHIMSQLAGYKPNGNIFLDGKVITVEQLDEVVEQFVREKYRTISVDTE